MTCNVAALASFLARQEGSRPCEFRFLDEGPSGIDADGVDRRVTELTIDVHKWLNDLALRADRIERQIKEQSLVISNNNAKADDRIRALEEEMPVVRKLADYVDQVLEAVRQAL